MKLQTLIKSFLQTQELFGQQSRYMRLEGYEVYSVGTGVLIRTSSDN